MSSMRSRSALRGLGGARALRAPTLIAAALLALPGAPGADAQASLVLKVATTQADGSPLIGQLEGFRTYVEQASSGRVQVKQFAAGALGDDAELLKRTRQGSIQAYAGTLDALSGVLPAAAVLGAPYLFDGRRRADAALDGPVRKRLTELLLVQGLRFAMWGPSDFRMWYSRHAPLRRPADAAGLKAPAPASPMRAVLFDALGVLAGEQPLRPVLGPDSAAPEIFDATLLEAAAASFDRGARHVTLSRHALESTVVVYSARWFDGLPEDLQARLDDLPKELAQRARRAQREAEPRLLSRLARLDIAVHKHDARARRAFESATRNAANKLAKSLGADAQTLLRSAR